MSNRTSRLDFEVTQAYREARATHGGLELDERLFKTNALETVKKHVGPMYSDPAAINFFRALHTDDLYLGLACAQGSEVAWDLLNTIYRKYIEDLAGFLTSASNAAELADSILVDLFLPNHLGRSRIGSFEGRSSLATWLRIIVTHRVMNEHDRNCNLMGVSESTLEIADKSALYKIEASLRACRYESIVCDSFQCSCERLTDRERLMLLWRFDEGLQLGEIARLFGVHQSTITRQLERTFKKLRSEVIATLSSKYGLTQAAIDECQDDILSNPSYSILNVIRGAAELK